MSQSIIGGATDYSEQTIINIQQDINKWINSAQNIQKILVDGKKKSEENGFWARINDDFQMTITSSIEFYRTVVFDLQQVDNAITCNHVTTREVKLLENIGYKSIEYNNEYPKTYKEDKRLWHDYGNPDFQVVENMYARGRDGFVSLQDALNAASRLGDYMQNGNTTNVNINGNVTGSQIQIGTVNSNQYYSVEKDCPYDEILKVVEEINKYRDILKNDLKENGDRFCKALDELTNEVKNKGNATKIKEGIETLKSFTVGLVSSIAATGVLRLLDNINF